MFQPFQMFDILILELGNDNLSYHFDFYEVLRSFEGKVEVVLLSKEEKTVHGKAGYRIIKPSLYRISNSTTIRKVMYDKDKKEYYILLNNGKAKLWNKNIPIYINKYAQ